MPKNVTRGAGAHMSLGDLAFHVLLAFGDGPSHGYAIGKDVETRSRGRLSPTTGALYQVLKRLREGALIEPDAGADSPDSRRKYFRLTDLGREAAALEAARLNELVDAARARKLFVSR